MKIDREYFRALLSETVDENVLACRALFSICEVEFTEAVDTLAVTLGGRSILKVNLDFLQRHCETEEQVKAVLIHEFLHVLLGHTLKFDHMTEALNISLDAVINAIIHRKLGDKYSSMMRKYYAGAEGLLGLLRPMEDAARFQATIDLINNRPVDPMVALHAGLYNGTILSEDVRSVAEDLERQDRGRGSLYGRPLLIGGHGQGDGWVGASPEEARTEDFRRMVGALDGRGIFRDEEILKPKILTVMPTRRMVTPEWRRVALGVLCRMLMPDRQSRRTASRLYDFRQPLLGAQDRRGSLRALWSPLIPDIYWSGVKCQAGASAQIYLDVSGSMSFFLDALVGLLGSFYGYIRRPLWAFSTSVQPAVIVEGRLSTKTGGGTSLACVRDHILKTRPTKALIVTDGFVESDGRDFTGAGEIEALIPHNGHPDVLKNIYGIPVTMLPELPK
jgi:hypothetical protein